MNASERPMNERPYLVRFQHTVSRTVVVSQNAVACVVAPNEETTLDAAYKIAFDQNLQDEFLSDWEDDDNTRRASGGHKIIGPVPDHRVQLIDEPMVVHASAAAILNLDANDF